MTEIKDPTESKPLKFPPMLNLDDPDEKLTEWAKANIGEDPERALQLIEELRDLIFEKGICDPPRTDDVFLLRFLRARNFIVTLAHKLLVSYTNLIENTPEFLDIDYNKLVQLSHEPVFSVPPYLDQDGRRLLFIRIGEWDTSKYSSTNLFQAVLILFHIALMEPKFQILGGQCIFDLTNLSVNHVWYMSPTVAKQIIQVAFSAMPIRIKAIHIINHSWLFDVAYGILKPFLTDMMQQRIIFHDNLESLHEYIDPKHLPKRYGGIHDDYGFVHWIDSLKDNENILTEMESLGYEGCREFLTNYKPSYEEETH